MAATTLTSVFCTLDEPTLNEFSCLEDPQKAYLGGEGKLCHLVEEQRAAVGLFEITFAGFAGPGEGSFLVPEELRVDGSSGMAPQLTAM